MQRNDRLRRQRIARNWRQQDLADLLGISVITIQRWERGSQQPSAFYRAKLSSIFGLSAQELGLLEATDSPISSQDFILVGQSVNPMKEIALWTVPYARNPYFTGRDELLDQLTLRLSTQQADTPISTRQAVLSQAQAIKGLGGIGKTQTAIEYAYRSREQARYTHIIWINAATEEGILTSFAALAELLPTFASRSEMDQRKLVQAIIRWLEQCEQTWLLILDNVEDFSLVYRYLPKQGQGCILLTTRASAVGSLALPIEVENMGVREGTQFLLRRAQRLIHASDEEIKDAERLVIELAQFPLALDQAGAYIEETGCSVHDYLQLYQKHRSALLARRGRQTTGYTDPVTNTWSVSFDHVEQASRAAADLLRLCALLAPDHIPEELLIQGAPYWSPALQEATEDRLSFNQMLETLLAFSLVKRLAEDRLLSIHRLVQFVQMERMSLQERKQWAERLVYALNATFPADPTDPLTAWPFCSRYLEQGQVCESLIREHQLIFPEAADLLDRVGTYLRERALYSFAEPLYQLALSIREKLFGLEHPDTARSLNHLGLLYYKQGRYAPAEQMYYQALRIREQQLGPDHLDTASTLYGLGNLYHQQDRYEEAEPLFWRSLHIREQQLGAEHPQVTYPLSKLALIYYKQGRYTEAEPLYQQTLGIRERQLGSDHPDIANSLTLLGLLYFRQGKYAEAEPLYQRALRIREHHLGPDHPDMVYPLINLGNLYLRQKKHEEAEPLYQQALQIAEHQVGAGHLLTAYPLTGLGDLYREQGKYAQSEQLLQEALQIREQQLGPEHSQVAYPLHGLANLYHKQGRYAEAETLYQRALQIREQVLGPRHLEVADVLYTFATFKQALKQMAQAISLYQRALTIHRFVLGSDHPITLNTRDRLYDTLIAAGQADEAVQLKDTDSQ